MLTSLHFIWPSWRHLGEFGRTSSCTTTGRVQPRHPGGLICKTVLRLVLELYLKVLADGVLRIDS